MFRRWLLPGLAVAFLGFGVAHALYIQKPEVESPPPVPPPSTPFGDTVAGAGIVEPNNEASTTSAISIGSQLSGVVTKVPVHIGQTVAAGDLLFELDKRATEADLKVKQAQVVQAQQSLRELELQPRAETVPPSEALVKAAEATSRQQKDEYDRTKKAFTTGAASPESLVSRGTSLLQRPGAIRSGQGQSLVAQSRSLGGRQSRRPSGRRDGQSSSRTGQDDARHSASAGSRRRHDSADQHSARGICGYFGKPGARHDGQPFADARPSQS